MGRANHCCTQVLGSVVLTARAAVPAGICPQ